MKTKHILLASILTFASANASAFDLKDILNSDKAKDVLSGIGSTIQNATSTTKFSVDDLVGTWKYNAPGVLFRSDNTLQNLGGAAAATTIENRLAPYYKKAGMENLTITVDKQHNFTIHTQYANLKGSVTKDSNGSIYFNFNAFGKYTLGKVQCMATKSGSTLTLAFDAKRIVQLLQKISKVANNSTFTSISNILSKYDGIYVGVKLKQSTK